MAGERPNKPEIHSRTPESSDRLKEIEAEKQAILDEAKAKREGLHQKDEDQKQTEETSAGQEVKEVAQPPDPFEDPDGFLMHMGDEMGPFGKLLVGFMAGSPFFGKFKKWMTTMKTTYGVEGAAKEAPRVALVQSFLYEKFDIHGDEAAILASKNLSEIIHMNHSPAGVRQKPFDNFVAGLKQNGAKKSSPGTVTDFIEQHQTSWKKIEDVEQA